MQKTPNLAQGQIITTFFYCLINFDKYLTNMNHETCYKKKLLTKLKQQIQPKPIQNR